MKRVIFALVAVGVGAVFAGNARMRACTVNLTTNEVRRCLSLETDVLRLGILPEQGGRLVDLADPGLGIEAFFPRLRATTTRPVDWKIVQDRRTGRQTAWIGGAEDGQRLRWTVGFSLPTDRAVLEIESAVLNRGTNAAHVAALAEGAHDALLAGREAPEDWCLEPHETRAVKQFWFPVKGIGDAKLATIDGAVNVERLASTNALLVGFHSTRELKGCTVRVTRKGAEEPVVEEGDVSIGPKTPWRKEVEIPADAKGAEFTATLADASGAVVLAYTPVAEGTNAVPRTAVRAGRAKPVGGSRRATSAARARSACRKGDFREALACVDAAIASGAKDAKLHVLRAYVLRCLGRFPPSSKAQRTALAVDPLDAWAVAERAFFEDDDGADAVRSVCACRGDPAKTLLEVVRDYGDVGAWREVAALCDQAKAYANLRGAELDAFGARARAATSRANPAK